MREEERERQRDRERDTERERQRKREKKYRNNIHKIDHEKLEVKSKKLIIVEKFESDIQHRRQKYQETLTFNFKSIKYPSALLTLYSLPRQIFSSIFI